MIQGRSVYTYDVIAEAEGRCRAVGNPDFTADHLNNELVYLTGRLSTQQVRGRHLVTGNASCYVMKYFPSHVRDKQ